MYLLQSTSEPISDVQIVQLPNCPFYPKTTSDWWCPPLLRPRLRNGRPASLESLPTRLQTRLDNICDFLTPGRLDTSGTWASQRTMENFPNSNPPSSSHARPPPRSAGEERRPERPEEDQKDQSARVSRQSIWCAEEVMRMAAQRHLYLTMRRRHGRFRIRRWEVRVDMLPSPTAPKFPILGVLGY